MLNRIGVLGDNRKFNAAVSRADASNPGALLRLGDGVALPPEIATVVHTPDALEEALGHGITIMVRQEELVELLATALDSRDMGVTANSKRVREHAGRFGKALSLPTEEQLRLERGALLRDIGKITIPNEILLKEGMLTYDEWNTIRQHTVLGAELVAGISSLSDIAEIVRSHHECYDRDGYPDGLDRDRIPLLARIVKIVDVFCAMTSPRHYRQGTTTVDSAVSYLHDEAGKHFDPELVKVFVHAKVWEATA